MLYIGRPWSALSFEGSRGVVVGQILDNLSFTSNGGCRREEKSRKHWSLFTKILSSITAIFLFIRSNQEQFHVLIALKIREK